MTSGWRLTLEPCGAMVAWSLIRVDDEHPTGQVWAGLIEEAAALRARAADCPDPSGGALVDPGREDALARELGRALLPAPLRTLLTDSTGPHTLTLLVRGWLAGVPWDALALDSSGTRLIERCFVLGGLPPGLAADVAGVLPAAPGPGTLWLVDPGPPDGNWPPLFPAGYPGPVGALVRPQDDLVPDGVPFGADALAARLRPRRFGQLGYLGHVTSDPLSPAAAALVLSDSDREFLFTAHQWLRDPSRWPAPPLVALIGCGSDDTRAFELAGLPTAALLAGARVVTGTRWPLPNTPPVVELLETVCAAQRAAGIESIRAWQLDRLDQWRRTGAEGASPLYWASLVSYDRALLGGEAP